MSQLHFDRHVIDTAEEVAVGGILVALSVLTLICVASVVMGWISA